jgi:hypothetical protein
VGGGGGGGGSGKGHEQRLDDCKEKRIHKVKEEALDYILENSLWKNIWTCGKTD